MPHSIAGLILRALRACGADHLFHLFGGTSSPYHEALLTMRGMRTLMVRHEQCAVLGALGFAAESGKPGVAIVIAGPGFTNALTSLVSARLESQPVILLTTTPSTASGGRQVAQDSSPDHLNTTGLARAAKLYCVEIRHASDAVQSLQRALRHALIHRKPVVLCAPMDVLRQKTTMELGPPETYLPATPGLLDARAMDSVARRLRQAKRPLLLVGRGARIAGIANQALAAFVEEMRIPYVTTPSAMDYLAASDLGVDVFGMVGTPTARAYVAQADCILVLGSSLGEASTAGFLPELWADGKLIQIDIDADILAFNGPAQCVVSDARQALEYLHGTLQPRGELWGLPRIPAPRHRAAYRDGIHPVTVLRALQQELYQKSVVHCDVGSAMFWLPSVIRPRAEQRFHLGLAHGAMGSAFAALGTAIAAPAKRHVILIGDCALMMVGADIHSLIEWQAANVTVIVLNNGASGLCEVGSKQRFGARNRKLAEMVFSVPMDAAAFARSLGFRHTHRVMTSAELRPALDAALHCDGPALVDVKVSLRPVPPQLALRNAVLSG